MTTYVVGDLQGCLQPLIQLLDKISFSPRKDQLWLVGDLVNRGPESLECLRFIKELGNSAITVLGNHDLHLLAVVEGLREPSPKDTLGPILHASDHEGLCNWLIQQPLLHTNSQLGCTLVHAGIHPFWTLSQAHKLADDTSKALQNNRYNFFNKMYGNKPTSWEAIASEADLLRFTVNVLTRMRYCNKKGELDHKFKGPPKDAPSGLYPWHCVPGRKSLPTRVVFGHWSSHPSISLGHDIPTDKGCVWGGCLAAYAIERECTYWVRCGI